MHVCNLVQFGRHSLRAPRRIVVQPRANVEVVYHAESSRECTDTHHKPVSPKHTHVGQEKHDQHPNRSARHDHLKQHVPSRQSKHNRPVRKHIANWVDQHDVSKSVYQENVRVVLWQMSV
jgi:hypothetical protein